MHLLRCLVLALILQHYMSAKMEHKVDGSKGDTILYVGFLQDISYGGTKPLLRVSHRNCYSGPWICLARSRPREHLHNRPNHALTAIFLAHPLGLSGLRSLAAMHLSRYLQGQKMPSKSTALADDGRVSQVVIYRWPPNNLQLYNLSVIICSDSRVLAKVYLLQLLRKLAQLRIPGLPFVIGPSQIKPLLETLHRNIYQCQLVAYRYHHRLLDSCQRLNACIDRGMT